ncbi:hypothetical protein [Verminephrobacter aporrectodeae]|nr:hypothetical protein [Verminephrobacter aporrectodeae]
MAESGAWALATPSFGMLHAYRFAKRTKTKWLARLADQLVRQDELLRNA